MPIYSKLPDDIQEVDIIIAGAGSAGCIVAGRLAAADPGLAILLIEGGRNNYNVKSIVHPVLLTQNLHQDSKHAIFYQANQSNELAGRHPIVPAGGVLGGGSSINFMLYTRGQRSDYDSWMTPGWSTDELMPFFRKLETYHGPGDTERHGYNGPVHVSDGGYRSKNTIRDVLSGAKAVGYPEIEDLQSFDDNNGFAVWLRTVSPEGRRQDTAHTFVHPLLQDGKHLNLHVLVEHQVVRVLFEKKRACGVELRSNPSFQADAPATQTVRARKLVVVSAGALGSPLILERSGVGDSFYLNRAGVDEVVNLPGVGHDYQDHNLIFSSYLASVSPEETANGRSFGIGDTDYIMKEKQEMIGWNGIDVCSKLRPTPAEVAALGEDFQAAWDRDFAPDPNRPMSFIGMLAGYVGDPNLWTPGEHLTVGNYTMYPYSRGHVHITGRDMDAPLDFDIGFFTDKHKIDIKQLSWAYKTSREVMRRTSLYRGEHPPTHPLFADDSPAVTVQLNGPLFTTEAERNTITNIVYGPADDTAIERYLRETTATTWHSLGTNKMAPQEAKGVVDQHLNVYGVTALKIVDLSIAPGNVAANTNNTAMVIGEKGADIIARELGLVLSDGPLV